TESQPGDRPQGRRGLITRMTAATVRHSLRVFSLRAFRIVALTEATSFLLLLVGSVLKRTADADILVTILGPIHGLLFITYVLIALNIRDDQGWSAKTTGLILLGAVLPFGGYVVDRWLTSSSRSPAAPSEAT